MKEGLLKVLTVVEAREKLAANLPAELRLSEKKPLLECLGRRLAKSITARENVPGFARSIVELCCQGTDTFGASEAVGYFSL